MDKLKKISTGIVVLAIILFGGGMVIPMKELLQYGLYVGITGVMGYAVMFIMSSPVDTSTEANS